VEIFVFYLKCNVFKWFRQRYILTSIRVHRATQVCVLLLLITSVHSHSIPIKLVLFLY